MVQRIRDPLVAEEVAAQSGVDGTPPLFLSDLLQPIIFGPQRPPLAASGYFPGCMGQAVAAVALNTSHLGLFVSGTNVDSIVRVNEIHITNATGTAQDFTIRRLDDVSGFSVAALVPGYISAGNPFSGGVFSAIRSNTVAVSGVRMATVRVEPNATRIFKGAWIINNGAIIVAPAIVNRAAEAYFAYEHWPSIRPQPIGG